MWGSAVLFVGDNGCLLSDYSNHVLLPKDQVRLTTNVPSRLFAKSIGHHNEWIQACKTGSPTTCNFDYSGALS